VPFPLRFEFEHSIPYVSIALQILWLGLTTNERLNWTRYTYFGGIGSHHGHHGHNSHPKPPKQQNLKMFNRGVVQNFVDFFEIGGISVMRPNKIDWMRTWASSPQYSNESDNEDEDSGGSRLSSDKNPLLRHNNDRDNYQYV